MRTIRVMYKVSKTSIFCYGLYHLWDVFQEGYDYLIDVRAAQQWEDTDNGGELANRLA